MNKEHLLKNEFQPIGGPIKDISWSPDNQRMVIVGEGRERYYTSIVLKFFLGLIYTSYLLLRPDPRFFSRS